MAATLKISIGIVKQYTYLGITYQQSGLSNLAVTEISAKANLALQSALSVIHEAKIPSWNSITVVDR